MNKVIIVSKCIKITQLNPFEKWHEFHFKGVCAGEALRKVLLKGNSSLSIVKGEEYLIYVQVVSCKDGVLNGTILKVKALESCWDKS